MAVRQVRNRRSDPFTQMKATGEVMAIDRTFEAALMKAIRGLEVKIEGPAPSQVRDNVGLGRRDPSAHR
ncbi:MAG: hypothetical protein U0S12_12320 [Fimbriimonadales bacterium]